MRMFQPSGPIFTIRDTYETLAEYESVTRGAQKSRREFFGKLAPISRRPVSIELRETIARYGD